MCDVGILSDPRAWIMRNSPTSPVVVYSLEQWCNDTGRYGLVGVYGTRELARASVDEYNLLWSNFRVREWELDTSTPQSNGTN